MKNKVDFVMDNFIDCNMSSLVRVPVVVVYKNPSDYPNKYVARLWDIGSKRTPYICISNNLIEIRSKIPHWYTLIPPSVNDDPTIIETYI